MFGDSINVLDCRLSGVFIEKIGKHPDMTEELLTGT